MNIGGEGCCPVVPNTIQLPKEGESVEFFDYESTYDKRYPCFECKYQGDMPTKIFKSPENPTLRQQNLPCRTAHYLCYYCAHNRPKYATWELLQDKVTIRAPTLNETKFVEEPEKNVKIESVTKEYYDTHFDIDPDTGKKLKSHYLVQKEVNDSLKKNPRCERKNKFDQEEYDKYYTCQCEICSPSFSSNNTTSNTKKRKQ